MIHQEKLGNSAKVIPAKKPDGADKDALRAKLPFTGRKRALTHMGGFTYRTELDSQPAIQSVILFMQRPIAINALKQKINDKILENQDYYRFHSIIDDELENFTTVQVKLEDHIRTLSLKKSENPTSYYGGATDEDAAFRNLVSDVTSRPLDKKKPLWEIVVVDDYHSKGFVIIWRIHHVIGDGSALVLCCQSLFDGDAVQKIEQMISNQRAAMSNKAKSNVVSEHSETTGASKISSSESSSKQVKLCGFNLRSLLRLIKFDSWYPIFMVALWFVIGFFRILIKWVWNGVTAGLDPHTVLKREHGAPITAEKRVAFSTNEISIEEARNVSRKVNATINDLMLCCLAGAVDKYTEHKKQPVKRQDIRITTPVNIRTSIEDFKVPRNKFGFMVSNLPLGITDCIERLNWIKKEMDYNKQLPERYFTYFLTYVVQKVLPKAVINKLYGYMSYLQSGIVTNVQSPPGQLAIDGVPMSSSVALTPVPPGSSLGVAVLSYHNYINISMTTEKTVIPDPELLMQYLLEEYQTVKNRLYDTKQ